MLCSLPVLIVIWLGAYLVGNVLHSRPGYDDLQLPSISSRIRRVVIAGIILIGFGPFLCFAALNLMTRNSS